MTLNPAYPVNWHYADLWKNKSLEELEKIRDKIYEKMQVIDRRASGNVNDEYSQMLEQLDYVMSIKRNERDDREAKADHSRRSER